MPPNRITAILKNEKGITANTAIRLGTFFKNRREAYRGQFDSKNEALRPENTLSWERITELAGI
jgi:plasmid maintenance system antidote protein VapI